MNISDSDDDTLCFSPPSYQNHLGLPVSRQVGDESNGKQSTKDLCSSLTDFPPVENQTPNQ